MKLSACIIAIGNELTEGRILNTNAQLLAQQLEKNAIPVIRMLTLRDDITSIQTTLQALFIKKSVHEPILIISGGLGGTSDDQTVLALARALNRTLVTDVAHLKRLQKIKHARSLPEHFLKQAQIPSGFTATANPWGTAPFLYEITNLKAIFLLPGVPNECLSLCEQNVIPLIKKHFLKKSSTPTSVQTTLKIIEHSETAVEAIITRLKLSNLQFAYLPQLGELLLILKHTDTTQPLKKRKTILQSARHKIIRALKPTLCYSGDTPLIEKLHKQFIQKKWKIGIAESCTGGLLASAFINIPDASKYLMLGTVAYSNDAKIHTLGVSPTTLAQHGAVSTETARAMAIGMVTTNRPSLALDLSIAITGIAGPRGGSRNKPVGTVYVCFHLPQTNQTAVEHFYLKGNRERIRTQTVQRTLVRLALFLRKEASFF